MKKKIIAVVAALIVVFSVGYFSLSKNNKNTEKISNTKVAQDFKVKSIFADVDMDMIVQDKDTKDEDTSGDYVFVSFTTDVADTKKNDNSNPFYIKNYKFDGKDLPEASKIYAKNSKDIVIKLPDGLLKGMNSSHSLDISKNLLDKNGKKIQGDLNVKLPYSVSNLNNDNKAPSGAADKDKKNSTSDKNTNSKNPPQNATVDPNANMPKYTIELGKGVPYTTVVLVKLDTKEPENYKVTVDGVQLEIKENKEGQKVFVIPIKKEYELDQVKKLIKIEKVK